MVDTGSLVVAAMVLGIVLDGGGGRKNRLIEKGDNLVIVGSIRVCLGIL